MKHYINAAGYLVITADADDRQRLLDLEGTSSACETEALDHLVSNSELMWISEGSTGDLTSAPMLGILGEEGTVDHTVFLENFGLYPTGKNGHWPMACPIIARWAYMHYQVRSFITDLIEKGECVWEGGYADDVIRCTAELARRDFYAVYQSFLVEDVNLKHGRNPREKRLEAAQRALVRLRYEEKVARESSPAPKPGEASPTEDMLILIAQFSSAVAKLATTLADVTCTTTAEELALPVVQPVVVQPPVSHYLYASCSAEYYGQVLRVGKDANDQPVLDIEVFDIADLVSFESEMALTRVEIDPASKIVLRDVLFRIIDIDEDGRLRISCDTPGNNCGRCTKIFTLHDKKYD